MTKEYLQQLISSGDQFALYFHQKSCGHCKEVNKVLPNTLPQDPSKEARPAEPIFKLLLDDYMELASALEVNNWPTLLVIKKQEFVSYIGSVDIINYVTRFNK